MIRVTNAQAVAYAAAHAALEDVTMENGRGMRAAELNALVEAKVQAFRMRMKAVFKEREKIVKDQAQKDRQGNLKYDNPAEPDPNKRILLWINNERATAALEAWQDKHDEIAQAMVDIDAAPLPDDFFTKPDELEVKQSVRAGFLPFMAKAQAELAAPAKSNKAKK